MNANRPEITKVRKKCVVFYHYGSCSVLKSGERDKNHVKCDEMALDSKYMFKVFRYSFSEAIPICFNRHKSDFILV